MPEKGYATASFIVDEAADSLWEGRRRDMVFGFFWGGGVWFCFGVLWVVFFLHAPAAVGCRRSIGSGLRGRRVGRDRYELGLSTRKQGDGHDEAIRMVRDLLSQPDFTHAHLVVGTSEGTGGEEADEGVNRLGERSVVHQMVEGGKDGGSRRG